MRVRVRVRVSLTNLRMVVFIENTLVDRVKPYIPIRVKKELKIMKKIRIK